MLIHRLNNEDAVARVAARIMRAAAFSTPAAAQKAIDKTRGCHFSPCALSLFLFFSPTEKILASNASMATAREYFVCVLEVWNFPSSSYIFLFTFDLFCSTVSMGEYLNICI